MKRSNILQAQKLRGIHTRMNAVVQTVILDRPRGILKREKKSTFLSALKSILKINLRKWVMQPQML